MKIRIYTTRQGFDFSNSVMDCSSLLDARIAATSFDKNSLEVMYNIDKAKLLDKDTGTIQTPFGVTDIEHLSLGCKTVLTYIYMANNRDEYSDVKGLYAIEAGWNALEELFRMVEIYKYDIGLIITHKNDLYNCKDRQYIIDDTEELTSLMWMI